MTTVNFAELLAQAGTAATSNNYEPLPDGDYQLKVIEAQATTTQTGKLMFKVTNEVQGGAHDKRRVWDQLVVTTDNPKAMNMFFMKASAMGLGQDYWTQNPTPAQIEQAFLGRVFRGTLGTRSYNGNQSNEIKRYYAATATPTVAAAAPAAAPAPAPAVAPAYAAAPAPAPAVAPAYAAAPAPAPAAPISADTPF
jgi:hypothetical protein